MHAVAAKGVALKEAMSPDFRTYARQVVNNARALAQGLMDLGFDLVSNGTDNHLILIDLRNKGELTGKDAERALEESGITVNKNTIPGETRSPFVTSGLRMGTPALTTRGMREDEMIRIAGWIAEVLADHENRQIIFRVREEVRHLCDSFPLYRELATLP